MRKLAGAGMRNGMSLVNHPSDLVSTLFGNPKKLPHSLMIRVRPSFRMYILLFASI